MSYMNFNNIQKNILPFEHYTFDHVFEDVELDSIYKLFETHTALLENQHNTTGKRVSYNKRLYLTQTEYKEIPTVKLIIDGLMRFFVSMYKSTNNNPLYLRVELLRDQKGFWLEPHVDIPEKKLSMMVYVNPRETLDISGTLLYNSKLEAVTEVPYKNNTGFYFLPGEDTWHGVSELKNGPRFSIMANVCTFETDFRL